LTEEPTTAALAKLLAPFLVLTAMVAVAGTLVLFRFTAVASAVAPPVVASFDVLKYTNAQRAVASSFLKPSEDISRTNELLLNLPERTRKVIQDIAGAGTLVVVKQAVVQGQAKDITDAVLTKLGLPTNVPTADVTSYIMNPAPTMLGAAPARAPEPAPVIAPGPQVLP
jgi:hypothetical protein